MRQRIFSVLVVPLHAPQSHETDLENHRSKADELIGDDRRAVRLESLEEAAGNAAIAEKVTQVADKANAILQKVNASQDGADKLKNQVAKFKV